MDSVALDTAALDLADLVARVEKGERIVLTREGVAVADLVPHPKTRSGGVDLKAREAFLRKRGIVRGAGYIPPISTTRCLRTF